MEATVVLLPATIIVPIKGSYCNKWGLGLEKENGETISIVPPAFHQIETIEAGHKWKVSYSEKGTRTAIITLEMVMKNLPLCLKKRLQAVNMIRKETTS